MRIEVVRGVITTQLVDAIVNAANSTLLGGLGVDGAIHAAGGPAILAACRQLRRTTLPDGLPPGEAVATEAGHLPAGWVIHTVGPQRWDYPDGGREVLDSCHRRSLEIAESVGASSIAFPAISCGAYGWDPTDAAPLAVAAVRRFGAGRPDSSLTTVRFVLANDHAEAAWRQAVASVVE